MNLAAKPHIQAPDALWLPGLFYAPASATVCTHLQYKSDVIPCAMRHSSAASQTRDPPGVRREKKAAALNPVWAPCAAQHEGCRAAHGVTGFLKVRN